MAVRDNIDVFVNDYIDDRLESAFLSATPLFYFLGLGEPENKNLLGRAGGTALFGGAKMGGAEKMKQNKSEHHQFRFLEQRYGELVGVEYGGATPTASGFTEDDYFTAQTQWTDLRMAAKTREHSFLFAEDAGELAIGAFVEEQLAEPWDNFVTKVHNSLWTGTRSSAQQGQRVWTDFLGLQHTLTPDNVYGRRDRTAFAGLQPSYIDASTDFSNANADLRWIRYANNGFTKAGSGAKFKGLSGRKSGGGARCWITSDTIWSDLANQAEGRYEIHSSGIPQYAMGGFKQPIIEYDNSYITWDPDCPDGEMYGLNLDYWVFEVHRAANFAWSGYTNKGKTEEGGEAYEWGNFHLLSRLTCRAPWLNVRINNVTTSSL